MDRFLLALDDAPKDEVLDPNQWYHLTLAIPINFKSIFYDTLKAYQRALSTDKMFPALEAMTMEARNSLDPVYFEASNEDE